MQDGGVGHGRLTVLAGSQVQFLVGNQYNGGYGEYKSPFVQCIEAFLIQCPGRKGRDEHGADVIDR
ncbi:hypothetical protein D3C85_1804180 [compost metagenome]